MARILVVATKLVICPRTRWKSLTYWCLKPALKDSPNFCKELCACVLSVGSPSPHLLKKCIDIVSFCSCLFCDEASNRGGNCSLWILALTAPLRWITFFCLFCLVYLFSVILPLVSCDFVSDNLGQITEILYFLFFEAWWVLCLIFVA